MQQRLGQKWDKGAGMYKSSCDKGQGKHFKLSSTGAVMYKGENFKDHVKICKNTQHINLKHWVMSYRYENSSSCCLHCCQKSLVHTSSIAGHNFSEKFSASTGSSKEKVGLKKKKMKNMMTRKL